MKRSRKTAAAVCLLLLVACDRDRATDAPTPFAKARVPGSAASGVTSSSNPTLLQPFRRVFVRSEQEKDGAQTPCGQPLCGVDACAHPGGLGMTCLEAWLHEKNPTVRRYQQRITDAQARLALDDPEVGAPPHAELALNCARSGPCRKDDDGYACLTAAEVARAEGDGATQKSTHERACRCGHQRARIPVMGGVLACDGPDRPITRGRDLTSAVAREVVACAACDHQTGPAACAAEIRRLQGTDAELSRYVDTQHVQSCRLE